ncbi:MAG TPA: NADPH-dependent F420 reductase, partial [Anaerolineales bacterium]|nr:NADPH-dependent F420 reductase [Anaerolineales bacterium]
MSPSNPLPTLAILGGTGKEGPGLALRWASAGYPILIGSRQAEKAEATAAELNAKLGRDCARGLENSEAARQADICVLTVVATAHQAALESLKDDLQGKILVDTTARVDFRDPHPPAAPSAGRIAQDLLGAGVRVAAAFQNVPASALKKNLGEKLDVDVLVCADDLETARVVMQLAEAAGMNAYYAGSLENALIVEGLTSLLISINKH